MQRVAAQANKDGQHPNTTRHRNKTSRLSNASFHAAPDCQHPPPRQHALQLHNLMSRRDDPVEHHPPTKGRHPLLPLFQETLRLIVPPEYESPMTHDVHLALVDDQERRAHNRMPPNEIRNETDAPTDLVPAHFFPDQRAPDDNVAQCRNVPAMASIAELLNDYNHRPLDENSGLHVVHPLLTVSVQPWHGGPALSSFETGASLLLR